MMNFIKFILIFNLGNYVLSFNSKSFKFHQSFQLFDSQSKNFGPGGRVKKVTLNKLPSAEIKNIIPSEDLSVKVESISESFGLPEAQSIPIEIPPKEEEKKEVEEEESIPKLPIENIIVQQVEMQVKGINDRQQQLSLLQEQLSKSIAKKQEVEYVISEEINVLTLKIQDIENSELVGIDSLRAVLDNLRAIAESKNKLISDSKVVLAQLKEVRDKITENSILNLLESSIDQKQELINIERDCCDDIYSLIFEVEAEIKRVDNKLLEIRKILKSLPSVNDREGARKYSWSDVESFQKQIIASIEVKLKSPNS